uniref:Sodium/potassium/calcium exchanger 1 n=1 Tax=Oryzias latipes TaxID=8090 RepID=A0A3P9KDH6_ORYLA
MSVRCLFVVSGVLLWTLFRLTMSIQLDYVFPETQDGDFGKTLKREMEEEMSFDSESTDHAYLRIRGGHGKSSPADLFSVEQRRKGWVILHFLGIMYMFVSLIIICDEFFLPAVGLIMEKLAVSDDVVGATFMAAGRSFPSVLFSLVTVFFTDSRVNLGGVFASGVYRIVFVTGMCAGLSQTVLHLSWWPLFRDLSFYLLYLILVGLYFLDNAIRWWESGALVAGYILYVTFMKFNTQAEMAFKSVLRKLKPVQTDNSAGASPKPTVAVSLGKALPPPCVNADVLLGEDGPEASRSLQWSDTRCKRFTIPDVRTQVRLACELRFYAVTFLVSIIWICVFSYFTHWWTYQVRYFLQQSLQFMGILILMICSPDLITSVIVTRKGLGNMAVSSSIGSSIFSMTVSLPLPLLLYSLSHGFAPAGVSSKGIFWSMMLLVLMLVLAIVSIISCKWKMNKALGASLVLLYIIFVVISILFLLGIIVCPLF